MGVVSDVAWAPQPPSPRPRARPARPPTRRWAPLTARERAPLKGSDADIPVTRWGASTNTQQVPAFARHFVRQTLTHRYRSPITRAPLRQARPPAGVHLRPSHERRSHVRPPRLSSASGLSSAQAPLVERRLPGRRLSPAAPLDQRQGAHGQAAFDRAVADINHLPLLAAHRDLRHFSCLSPFTRSTASKLAFEGRPNVAATLTRATGSTRCSASTGPRRVCLHRLAPVGVPHPQAARQA